LEKNGDHPQEDLNELAKTRDKVQIFNQPSIFMAKNLKPNKKSGDFNYFFSQMRIHLGEKRKKEKEKRKEKYPMLGRRKWMDHETLKRCDKSTSFLFVLVVVVCGWVENRQK